MKSGVRHSRLDRQKETLVWKKRRKQRLLSASIVPSRWDMKTKKPRDTKTKSAPSSACAKAQLSVPVLLRGFGRTYNTFTERGTFSFIFESLVPDDDVRERWMFYLCPFTFLLMPRWLTFVPSVSLHEEPASQNWSADDSTSVVEAPPLKTNGHHILAFPDARGFCIISDVFFARNWKVLFKKRLLKRSNRKRSKHNFKYYWFAYFASTLMPTRKWELQLLPFNSL